MSVDDGGDCVRCIVEAVDKLESQGNEQRGREQDVGPDADDRDMAYVTDNVESAISQAAQQHQRKDHAAQQSRAFLHLLVKQVAACRCCYCRHWRFPPELLLTEAINRVFRECERTVMIHVNI